MDNLIWAFILLNVVTFLGGFSKGLSGFGAPLVMVPLFSIWLPMTVAVPLTILLSLFATVPMIRLVWPFVVIRRDIFAAICYSVGTSFGVHLLVTVPEAELKFALGLVLILFVTYMFLRVPAPEKSPEWTPRERVYLGAASTMQGVVSGAVGGGALPLVPYLTIRYQRSDSRAIFVMVFSIGTFFQLAGYTMTGLVDRDLITLAATAAPGMVIGVVLGAWLHPRVNARFFARMIAFMLLFPALKMVGLV